jgi:predicted RNA-binding protein with PUA-like domain
MSEKNILEDQEGNEVGSKRFAVEEAKRKPAKRVHSGNLFLCLQYLPMDYLLKTEPTVYSFADLEREKTTIWDGVTNPTAVKHLREMKPGERLVIYHTGDEKSAVGTASVVSVDASDPRTPQVKIKVGKTITKPKTLSEIKARAAFAESPLVRQGRLSVVPLTAAQYGWLAGD